MCVLAAVAGLAGCPAQARDPMPGDPIDDPTDDPTGNPTGNPTEEPFFVDINAGNWKDLNDGGHTFLLMTDTGRPERVSSATIRGSEVLGDDSWDVEGMFENRAIHFTSTLRTTVREFTGTFRDEMTMELTTNTSPASIVLKKQDLQ